MEAKGKMLSRFRALAITVALAVFANIAISYAADAFASKKSGSTVLPSSPRPKSGSTVLPSSPRP